MSSGSKFHSLLSGVVSLIQDLTQEMLRVVQAPIGTAPIEIAGRAGEWRERIQALSLAFSDRSIETRLPELVLIWDQHMVAKESDNDTGVSHRLVAVVVLTLQELRKLKEALVRQLRGHDSSTFKSIFFDCGSNVGQGLTEICRRKEIDATWKIHCFEPNPFVLSSLRQVTQALPAHVTILEKAVWIENCERQLTLELQENRSDSFETRATGGATNVFGDQFQRPDYLAPDLLVPGPTVGCIDFVEYLSMHADRHDHVIVKLDCEGAELLIIPKLLETGAISLIDELFIEWHGALVGRCAEEQALQAAIALSGVIVHPWH